MTESIGRDPGHPAGALVRPGVENRQVDWYSVHQFVAPYLDTAGRFPMAGTLAWQLLSDTDPAKWAALLDAAQHHVLRVETGQQALAEAQMDVSEAADWAAIANSIRQRDGAIRTGAYIPRRRSA